MVLPVTGPFASSRTANGPPNSLGQRTMWFSESKAWRRQHKPYNLVLPYSVERQEIKSLASTDPTSTVQFSQCASTAKWAEYIGPASVESFNKARLDFVNKLSQAHAELGSAIGERKKSLQMIAKRSNQLLTGFRQIKKLQLGAAARTFGISLPRGASRKKQFSDNLLEFRFGWGPLVGDVSGALKVLTRGLPSARVLGFGAYRKAVSTKSGGPLPGTPVSTLTLNALSRHRIRARVGISDPNLALASSLGLVNPVAVAWELVPFSFVLDYFVNVGEYLNGFTDLLGFDLRDVAWTWRGRVDSTDGISWFSGTSGSATWVSLRDRVQRDVGPLPGTILAFRQPWQLMPWRAATSVALLVQFMGKR